LITVTGSLGGLRGGERPPSMDAGRSVRSFGFHIAVFREPCRLEGFLAICANLVRLGVHGRRVVSSAATGVMDEECVDGETRTRALR
jgi:hypothetical protein